MHGAKSSVIQNRQPYLCDVAACFRFQGHEDLNPEPLVLETNALPVELYPYIAATQYARTTPGNQDRFRVFPRYALSFVPDPIGQFGLVKRIITKFELL